MADSRKDKSKIIENKMRLWTIICLLLVCIAAFALRGFIIYKMYPLNYKQEISDSSAKYALDKYFVCSVICAESHFNKKAVSHTGAVGLMQIMPSTGEWVAKKMGMKDYTDNMLFDPETNIAIGCWYLNYLSDLFDGDRTKIVAAYNAGPAKVQEWIEKGKMGDIPYKDTEKYVETVDTNYVIYKGLYENF